MARDECRCSAADGPMAGDAALGRGGTHVKKVDPGGLPVLQAEERDAWQAVEVSGLVESAALRKQSSATCQDSVRGRSIDKNWYTLRDAKPHAHQIAERLQ